MDEQPVGEGKDESGSVEADGEDGIGTEQVGYSGRSVPVQDRASTGTPGWVGGRGMGRDVGEDGGSEEDLGEVDRPRTHTRARQGEGVGGVGGVGPSGRRSGEG